MKSLCLPVGRGGPTSPRKRRSFLGNAPATLFRGIPSLPPCLLEPLLYQQFGRGKTSAARFGRRLFNA
jgi:hypothetical protein